MTQPLIDYLSLFSYHSLLLNFGLLVQQKFSLSGRKVESGEFLFDASNKKVGFLGRIKKHGKVIFKLEVFGCLANDVYSFFLFEKLDFKVWITRVDAQITLQKETTRNHWLNFLNSQHRKEKKRGGFSRNVSLMNGQGDSASVYIGSRRSDKTTKVYQKKGSKNVRFEVELKRKSATKFHSQTKALGLEESCRKVLKKEIKGLSRCDLLDQHRKYLLSTESKAKEETFSIDSNQEKVHTLEDFLNKNVLGYDNEAILHLQYTIFKNVLNYEAGDFSDYQILFLNDKYPQLQTQQILTSFFKSSNLVALDTEFIAHKNPWQTQLFYIQVANLNQKKIIIITKPHFDVFCPLFLNWIKTPNKVLLGFNCIADLSVMVVNLFPSLNVNIFEHKILDFYLLFKFICSEFIQNHLSNWAERLCDLKMDKSLKETDWSSVEITNKHKEYLAKNVFVLLKFCEYLYKLVDSDANWINTWKGYSQKPLELSLKLDHVLIPQFLQIYLNGVCLDVNELQTSTDEIQQKFLTQLKTLNLNEKLVKSPKQLEKALKDTNGFNHLLEIWPRTQKYQQLEVKNDTLQNLLTNKTLNRECTQWLDQLLKALETKNILQEMNTINKARVDNYYFPQWDILGARTGRILTKKPTIQNIPRRALFRKLFSASKGHSFIICDYSMIELLIIACIAGVQSML